MNSIKSIIFFGFFLRFFVAIWNGFFGPSFGADIDALAFHDHAVEVSRTGFLDDSFRVGWIYSGLLGILYQYISDHIFFGSLISCICWFYSAKILYLSLKELNIENKQMEKGLLIYSLIPSSILFTSVTLREVYQLFFVNLAFYSVIQIYLKNLNINWFFLIFSIVGMGALHGALMASGILIFLGLVFSKFIGFGKKLTTVKITTAIITIIIFFMIATSIFGDLAYNLDSGVLNAVEKYQEGVLSVDARANYRSSVDMSSATGIFLFFITSIFQYLLEPFPWNISALPDVAQLTENILRIFLIITTLNFIINKKSDFIVKFLLISYFIIETTWSIGTSNWGTAIRHHIPSWGILIITYSYTISKNFEPTK